MELPPLGAPELDWVAVGRLSQRLSRARERGELLNLALELVRGPIGAAAAAVWTYGEAGTRLELAAEDGLSSHEPRPDWTDMFKAPLHGGGHLVGVLEAYTLADDGFGEAQLGALQTAAALLAVGLAARQLSDRVVDDTGPPRVGAEAVEAAWRLWRATAPAGSFDELFETLALYLPEQVTYDAALFVAAEEPSLGLLQVRTLAAEHLPEVFAGARRAAAAYGIDLPEPAPDALATLGLDDAPAEGPPVVATLAVPLLSNGDFRGLLYLVATHAETIGETAAQTLFSYAAWALESMDRVTAGRVAEAERLMTIVESLPQGVVLLDADGRVLLCNAPGSEQLRLLGADDERVAHLAHWDVADLVAAAEGSRGEVAVREAELRVGEQTHNLQITVVPVREAGDLLGTVLSIQDVSDQRQTEQRLFCDARLASVGELASGLAHELNNPLMIVIGLAELLSDAPGMADEHQPMLADLHEAATRAGQIVKQLMVFADIQVGECWDCLPLREVMDQAVDLVASTCEAEGVKIELDWPDRLPPVPGNAGKLQQLMLVLLRNAYEAIIQDRPPRLDGYRGHIWLRARLTNHSVDLEVEDDGPGVPEEIRERIFDVFFTTKRDWKGKGLGLSIAHRLAREHGAPLAVEQGPHGGALFRLSLPLMR